MVRSFEVARAANIPNLTAWTLNELGRVYLQRGRFVESAIALQDALALLQTLRDRKGAMFCQGLLSLAELFAGKPAKALEHADASVRAACHFNIVPEAVIGLTVQSLLLALGKDTLGDARKLAGEATRFSASFVPHTVGAFVASLVADYMLGVRQAVQDEIRGRLRESLEEGWLPYSVICLALMAVLMAHESKHARAAEVLGLALSHPAAPLGWLDRWPLLANEQELMRGELGVDAYAAAWERGKSLDWDVAVRQALAGEKPR